MSGLQAFWWDDSRTVCGVDCVTIEDHAGFLISFWPLLATVQEYCSVFGVNDDGYDLESVFELAWMCSVIEDA